ncbi:MarR family transcriptional regulator [Microvirga yunnanensis]|uniref:MarR family transcriptional regulator n=1 Tax=Microvirga yunnanensis TaxID=2953740 RepID=UPI0021C6C3F9|nr:helix-turn-helix domain-containing protein [Microvirga sp. HBU65207]
MKRYRFKIFEPEEVVISPKDVMHMKRQEAVFECIWSDRLTPQERRTFNYIAKQPHRTNAEIADAIKLAPEQVSRAVKTLLGLGWIMFRVSPEDRRVRIFGMTEEGYREICRIMSVIEDRKISLVDGITVWTPDQTRTWTPPLSDNEE